MSRILLVASLCLGPAAACGVERALDGVDDPPPLAAPPPRDEAHPAVWLAMRNHSEQLAEPKRWDQVRAHLDGYKLMRSNFALLDHHQLAALVATLRASGIPIHLEVSGPRETAGIDARTGIESARREMAAFIEPLGRLGAVPVSLDIDWQVQSLRAAVAHASPGRTDGEALDACAHYLVDYLQTIRAAHPAIGFSLLTNLPNWRWKGAPSHPGAGDWGDYHVVLSHVVPSARAAGVPLRGLTVDFPFDYLARPAPVPWVERVRELERYARAEGLEFNLILNDAEGGARSDTLFFDHTLADFDLYRSAGVRPDRFIVQSWYPHPAVIAPESAPSSMTALVEAILERR